MGKDYAFCFHKGHGMKLAIVSLGVLSLGGCAWIMGNVGSSDPTERGFSYVAGAIVLAAILRAIFNR